VANDVTDSNLSAPAKTADTGSTGIAHIVLRVSNWRESARWYEGVLGFERHKADAFSYLTHAEWNFILLLLPSDANLEPTSASTQRLDHLALHVATPATLEAWRDRLTSTGMSVKVDQAEVGSSITLHDPDGLELELFCPRDGSPLSLRSVP
jgi:catechol 2,3-dioxygenase